MNKSTDFLVQALKEALAHPEEQPLYKSGKQPGLFPSRTGVHLQAAEQALRDGLLEPVRTESKGKAQTEWVRITPRGVQFVYQHESPKAVLEELVQILRVNLDGMPRWAEEMRAQLQALVNRFQETLDRQNRTLEHLRLRTEEALRRLGVSAEGKVLVPWQLDALDYLSQRRAATHVAECTLPELFAALREKHPQLVVADFHSGLAQLRDRGAVTLLPYAGHLSELAEPEYALLEGANVFYAIKRS